MHVHVKKLIPGCVLREDVYVKTASPVMKRKTVLTDDHIYILEKFLIEDVEVFQQLANGQVFNPGGAVKDEQEETAKDEDDQATIETDSFLDRYLAAVESYKKHFKNWQAGSKIEAYDVRKIFLPLYEREPNKYELMQLLSLNTKQEYTYHHAVAVSIFSFLLGKADGLKSGEVIQLGLAGLLSDCGMAKLPFSIFNKSGSLTAEEYEEIKKHPIYGYRMLESVPGFSKNALLGVLQHHEREDGSGYPLQVNREKLHPFAKMIAIADTYHAMTSERPYRSAKSPYLVMDELLMDGFGKLDHHLIHKLIPLLTDLSIGDRILLNNDMAGEVVFLNQERPTKPVVTLDNGKQINLIQERDIHIESLISRSSS